MIIINVMLLSFLSKEQHLLLLMFLLTFFMCPRGFKRWFIFNPTLKVKHLKCIMRQIKTAPVTKDVCVQTALCRETIGKAGRFSIREALIMCFFSSVGLQRDMTPL